MEIHNAHQLQTSDLVGRKRSHGWLISMASAALAMALVPMTQAGAVPVSATSPTLSVIAGTGTDGSPTAGPATSSQLNQPYGVALDASGNVYIADSENNVIERVAPSGTLSIIAGNGTAGPPTAGPAPATGSNLNGPSGVAVDSVGNVYIADAANHVIEKVTPSGTLSVIAGTGEQGSPTAGPATSSSFDYPTGVAVDASNNLYVADLFNNVVEKITPSGTLSIFAGTGTSGVPTAGKATSSQLSYPQGVAVDSVGNVYIADAANHVIEKVTPSGTLSIIAGNGTRGHPTAGPATSSNLNGPSGVAVDFAGNVVIADRDNNVVEKVTPSGTLSVIAGTGEPGSPTAGPATSSSFNYPTGVAVDASGNVYIADENNYLIEKVALVTPTTPAIANLPRSGTVGASFTPTVSTNGDGSKTVTSSTPNVCTLNSDKVHFIGVGTCTLVAHVAIGVNFTAANGTAQSIVVSSSASKVTPPADQVVYFAPGSSLVSQAGITAIQKFAAAAKASHVSGVTVTGYASQSGPLAANIVVSEQRANAVAHLLRSALGNLHVSGVTIQAVGGGVRTVAKTDAGNRIAILHVTSTTPHP